MTIGSSRSLSIRMRRLRYLSLLLLEFAAYATLNRSPWLFLFVLMLLLLSAAIVMSQSALPYMYTIF